MRKKGGNSIIFNKKNIALSEISLMILSVFAVAFLMGNLGTVSAEEFPASAVYEGMSGIYLGTDSEGVGIYDVNKDGVGDFGIIPDNLLTEGANKYEPIAGGFDFESINSPATTPVATGVGIKTVGPALGFGEDAINGVYVNKDNVNNILMKMGDNYYQYDPVSGKQTLLEISGTLSDNGYLPATTTQFTKLQVDAMANKIPLEGLVDSAGVVNVNKFKQIYPKYSDIPNDNFIADSTGNVLIKNVDGSSVTFNAKTGFGNPSPGPVTQKPFVGTLGVSSFGLSHLIDGFTWALGATAAIQALGSVFGVDKDNLKAVNIAVVSGIFAGQISYGLFAENIGQAGGEGALKSWIPDFMDFGAEGLSPAGAAGIGIATAAIIFVLTYEKESEKRQVINFQCLPFEPQLGGAKCEECNADPFRTCSEYRCKSLGQACALLNAGTGKELCAWIGRNDVNSPVIKPWEDALRPDDLKYTNDNTRPPSRGVKITTQGGGCLKAFTQLEFGITTDEPSQCKIDYEHTKKFDEMRFYMGGSNYYAYNHSDKFNLPSVETIVTTGNENDSLSGSTGTGGNGSTSVKFAATSGSDVNSVGSLTFPYDGEYSYYIRCRDGNGNENVDEYAVSFCVDPSPDTTPPIIDSTSIKSGGFVRYNVDNVSVEVYTNEAAECKWSRTSKNYDDMENNLNCAGTYQVNAEQLYTCTAKLTGIKNKEDNKFYFRCKDNPGAPEGERNVMTQSYELILKGTEPLQIVDVSPNGTITSSTSTTTVDLGIETANGAEEGKSLCYFSTTNSNSSYVAFFESNNYIHKQSLDLASGSYTYYLRCIDAGGNSVDNRTSFTVFVDKFAPKVTRVYKEEALKIVTDEDAVCGYSLNSCNFNVKDGVQMIYSNPNEQKNHYTEWESSKTYYIRCKDKYENEPDPNKCSIIVSAVQFTNPSEE